MNYCLDDLGLFGVDESIMIVVGFTLPLASQGCNAYLGTPDSFILKVRTDSGSLLSFYGLNTATNFHLPESLFTSILMDSHSMLAMTGLMVNSDN